MCRIVEYHDFHTLGRALVRLVVRVCVGVQGQAIHTLVRSSCLRAHSRWSFPVLLVEDGNQR